MKYLVFLILCGGSIVAGWADDQPLDPAPRPSPEQRRPALEELRQRNPEALLKLREKRREEIRKLPLEERQAKLKELRERALERRKAMTGEEIVAKRKEIKARLERQLVALRQKKTGGTLTAQESKRLHRLETIAQRFKEAPTEAERD